MSNRKTKSNDIIRCKDCNYNPSVAKGFSKYVCPLVIVDGDIDYIRTPDDDWFCANGGYLNNLGTTADIVRCKDCINNPYYAKGFNKRACPHDKSFYESAGKKIPDGEWFCANGEKGEIIKYKQYNQS